MDLGGNTRPPFSSLDELANRLRARSKQEGPLGPGDADLKLLDWVVHQLLQVTAALHHANGSIGLLHPRNVLWYHGANGPRLVLPDVGFVWREGFVAPPWLRRDGAFAPLWDREPETLNTLRFTAEADARAADGETRDAQSDLRTLSRLFDWVLSGQARRQVPPPREGDEQSKAQVWSTLEAAQKQRVQNAEALGAALDRPGHRLSDYFRAAGPPEPPRQRWWRNVLPAAAVVVALVGATGVGYFLIRHGPVGGDTPGPHPLCPECPVVSNLYRSGLLDELQQALGDPKKELDVLQKMYQLPPSPTPEVHAGEQECLKRWRLKYGEGLDRRGGELSKKLLDGKHAPDPATARHDIEDLLEEYKAYQSLDPSDPPKEPEWLPDLELLLRQYLRL
jgi:hypothetical protein